MRQLSQPPHELAQHPLGQIKTPVPEEARDIPLSLPSAMFLGSPSNSIDFLSVDQYGFMFHHLLRPHGPTPAPKVDPTSLLLTVHPFAKWDIVQRVPTWKDFDWVQPPQKSIQRREWASQIEITTHNPYLQSLPLAHFSLKCMNSSALKQALDDSPPVFYEKIPATDTAVSFRFAILLSQIQLS